MSNFLRGSCFSHEVPCPNLLREAIAPHTYREAALHLPHLGIFRMLKYKLSVAILAVVLFGVCAESCEAGPLLDWLRGVPPTRPTVTTPIIPRHKLRQELRVHLRINCREHALRCVQPLVIKR